MAVKEDVPEDQNGLPYSLESTTENEDHNDDMKTALRAQLVDLRKTTQEKINRSHLDMGIGAWIIEQLRPIDVPTKHSFEMKDPTPIFHRARRKSSRHICMLDRLEIIKILDAGIITATMSAWKLQIVIVMKNDGMLRFCVIYRILNRKMKADRRPLPMI